MVELWVGRGAIFRPCPDPDPSDASCSLESSGTPAVAGIPDYSAFFASLYVGAFRYDGAPWTRLGYTFDWGGSRREDVGASEYMVTTSTPYTMARSATIADYCSATAAPSPSG